MGRRLAAAAAVVAALPVGAATAATPAQTLASALAAGRGQRSVHYATDADARGVRVTMVGDAAVDRGIQRITYSRGGRTGQVTVIVVADTAYLRGDAFTLQNYMGFSAGEASSYAGKWVRIPRGASGYSAVAAGVRLGSTMDEEKLSAPLVAVGASVVGGRRVVGIRSTHRASGRVTTETLYVSAQAPPLPVEEVARQGSNNFTVMFSRWNERVHLAAPARSVLPTNTA